MSRTWTPYKAGLQRGLLETKHTLTSPADLMGMIMPTGIALVVIFAVLIWKARRCRWAPCRCRAYWA